MVLQLHVARPRTSLSVDARVNRVVEVLASGAAADYVGEPVSQLEHALQAGALARRAGAPELETVAALLHDIGHLDAVAPDSAPAMLGTDAGRLGVASHEQIGAAWLDALGFDARVGQLVAAHVEAKRYLVATRASYAARLSEASRQTLALQGGPMGADELARFERDPLREAKLRVRSWDEGAKLPGAEVEGLATWTSALRELLVGT